MTWRDDPRVVDLLAAEYAVGTLRGGARRRFARMAERRPAMEWAVERWLQRMLAAWLLLPPQAPSPAVWQAIEQRLWPQQAAPAKAGRWWQRWWQPVPAAALVMGLVMGTLAPSLWQVLHGPAAPQDATQLPQSYVGVLGLADGRPGLVVSSLRHGRVVDVKTVNPVAVPQGQSLYLWALDAKGVPTPVAALPSGPFVQITLPAPAEQVFSKAVELAVSLEPAGSAPSVPGGAFVYRGLCGKLWRVP